MSLINCPECNKYTTNIDKKCQHCGYPLGKENNIEQNSKIENYDLKSIYNELISGRITVEKSLELLNSNRKIKEFENEKNEESSNLAIKYKVDKNVIEKKDSEKMFYKIITENFSCIKSSVWLFTKNIDMFLKYYEKLQMKISKADLLDIFEYVVEIASNCNTINEFNSVIENIEFNQLLEIYFYDENIKKIFESGMVSEKNIDYLMNEYCNDFVNETLKGLTSYTNQMSNVKTINDYIVWVSYKYSAFVNLLCAIIGIIKVIFLSKYIKLIISNEELMKIIKNGKNNHNININDLYNLYNEFYGHILPETLNIFDFELLINLSLKYNEYDIKQTEKIFQLANINIEKLIVDCNNYSFVYKFFTDIVDVPDFKDVIRNDAFERIIVQYIPYYLSSRVSLNDWLNYLFEQEKIIKKINLYIKKKILLNQECQTKVQSFLEKYDKVQSGEEFERFLKEIYESLGFSVELTSATGDQGADLIIERSNIKTAVQAKFYNSTVGNTAVQEVVGAISYYKANKGIVVTNSIFTNSAIDLAKANKVELIDGKILLSIINTIL